MTAVDWDETPRPLTNEEVEDIIGGIRFSTDPNPVQKHILQIHHEKTRKKLKTIKILPSKVTELKRLIVNEFYKSVVPYGEAVGVNSAQCIGEPSTQLCNVKTDRIIAYNPETKEFYNGPIGDFIDRIMEKAPVQTLHGDSEVTTFGDGDDEHFVLTVDPNNETCDWMKLCEVSRHPTKGDLAKITTKSGRYCTTTLSHSHLKRTKEGKIVPIVAKNLNEGDFIPVLKDFPHFEQIDEIEMGDKMEKLDFEFGWYMGAYLAEGSIHHKTVKITNISIHFEERCKALCQRFGAIYYKREYVGNFRSMYPDGRYSKDYPGADHHFRCCKELGEFTLKHCKTGSANKVLPPWVYFAPLPFIRGLLRGYFDGDGNVNEGRQTVRAHSINQTMLQDLSLLLSIFGIFATLKVEKTGRENNLYNLTLSRKHIPTFYKEIGTDFPEKESTIRGIIDYLNRDDKHSLREDTDRIPECGELIADTAYPLKLPGYSRNYKRWTKKKAIGRETLRKYHKLFSEKAVEMGFEEVLEEKLALMKQAIDSEVIWDEIVKIEIINDPKETVYDFGVEGNHTFMVNAGVFVHNTLNSVAPWEKILFANNAGETTVVEIGDWIDSLLKENVKDIVHIPENRTQYLELKNPVWTPTPTSKGQVNWDAITAVTKHLPVGNLVRITTGSGRTATVTRSKSLLVWENEELVPKNGSDVKLGDLCPVILNFPEFGTEITHVKLMKYLSPKEWVYGTELMSLYNAWVNDKRVRREGFWTDTTLAKLPFTRGDSAIVAARRGNVKSGIIYPKKNIASVKSTIPEEIELTEEFGIIMGLYLADGWATNTFVGLSNNCPEIQDLIKSWCDKYNITYHTVVTESTRFPGGKSTDLKIHSVILARWFKLWVGTGSSNKNMPMESFTGSRAFAKGLLNGYFAGDGCVCKNDGALKVSSASENLILGFSALCTRFGIFGKKSGTQATKNNINSPNIKYLHSYNIRNNFVKIWIKEIGCCHPPKKEIMDGFIDYEYKYPYGYLKEYFNDINLDPIVKIEEVPATEYVYDLTVPETKNFSLFNGCLTRDTFHFTGQSTMNVTLGFPRARELFNSTKTPSNPICTVYFMNRNRTPEQMHKYTDRLPQATIEDLLVSWSVHNPEEYVFEYWHKVWFKLNDDFGELTADDWCLRLQFNIEKLYEHNLSVKEIGKKLLNIYDEIRCIPSPLNLGILDVIVDCKNVPDGDERTLYMKKIVAPKFRGQLICGIPGIKKVYRRKAKVDESFGGFPLKPEIQKRLKHKEEWIAETEGTNLSEILTQPGVDSYRTMSNDMWEIQSLFGIEAARFYLYLEFMNVVSSGGVSINPVHIQILVDKMCYTGSIRAIARFGIETAQYDPIARATFEEVLSQIITSAMFSEKDNLNGISSNIVLGTKINAGTGAVSLEDIPLTIKKK